MRREPAQPAAPAQVGHAAEQPVGRVLRLQNRRTVRVAGDHTARLCQRDGRRETPVATHRIAEFHQQLFITSEVDCRWAKENNEG